MLQRTRIFRLLNVSSESPSFRAKPGFRNFQAEIQSSPYKEQFKDYWTTPVAWQDREYGEKPKLGDPIPTRRAASTLVVARNRHIDPAKVASGEDNDYKVLMHFREGKGRYVKDTFSIPAAPVNVEDRNSESWAPVLQRRGLSTKYRDMQERLCAFRSLFIFSNMIVIPKEGGGLAEVEGPPGPKKWAALVSTHPRHLRDLIDALELPLESVFNQFRPFRKMVTPTTETFRFENTSYVVTFEKIPCVQYTLSHVGERLVWVSPMEALARFNAGIMNMPTPNAILLSELNNQCPTFEDVSAHLTAQSEPVSILPELVYSGSEEAGDKVATILVPGDMHHSHTTDEDKSRKYVRRFVYEKDYPYGVRAVFEERPATVEEEATELKVSAPLLLEEANDMDMVYADVPYLKRNVKPEDVGKALYNVQEFSLQEGAENAEGIIPNRQVYSGVDRAEHEDDWVKAPTPALQRLRERSHPTGPNY